MNKQQPSTTIHIALWIAQAIVAVFLLTGAVMKFLPIAVTAPMMPWTGQIPEVAVRCLGLIDLLGAIGLILPSWLRIKPQLSIWAATGVVILMAAAILFHVSRGEASVTGLNIAIAVMALFITWGRLKKAPISAG